MGQSHSLDEGASGIRKLLLEAKWLQILGPTPSQCGFLGHCSSLLGII